MIRLDGLTTGAGAFTLGPIDLSVETGEYFVLVGPSAAGKTFLLETIAGLRPLRGGRLVLEGQDRSATPPQGRRVALVYQHCALFPHLCVRENVTYPLVVRRQPAVEIEARLAQVVAALGIGPLLDRLPSRLSGGEKQRVALARGLIAGYRIVLLDEPYASLDAPLRRRLASELAQVHRRLQTTTIHVTHDFQEALLLADRIGVLAQGQLVQVGTCEEILRRPASPVVAALSGAENVFSILRTERLDGRWHVWVEGGLELTALSAPGSFGLATLRPEDVRLSVPDGQAAAPENTFEGLVREVRDLGPVLRVVVEAGARLVVLVTPRDAAGLEIAPGRRVRVGVDAGQVHLL